MLRIRRVSSPRARGKSLILDESEEEEVEVEVKIVITVMTY